MIEAQRQSMNSAIAWWTFAFMRDKFSRGLTLNEIEKRLDESLERGELDSFVEAFEKLRLDIVKRKRLRAEKEKEANVGEN